LVASYSPFNKGISFVLGNCQLSNGRTKLAPKRDRDCVSTGTWIFCFYTRLPLVANGTVDIECGSTANMTSRQAQVGFSYTFFVPQFKWIARANTGIKSADDLRGKTVAVTAGTNTALFVNKMNNEGKLGMTIMQGKDHAESFLLVETGRASAWMEDDILIA